MSIQNDRYHGFAQLLHWLIALLVVAQFSLAWGTELVESREVRGTMMLLHKSSGMTILMLVIVRVLWRLTHSPPPYSTAVAPLERRFAPLAHWLLYVLIFLMPLTGWMVSSTAGRSTQWFWLFTFPDLAGKNEAWHETLEVVHEAGAWALFALALLHVLTAFWHMHRGDGVMQRMLPGR